MDNALAICVAMMPRQASQFPCRELGREHMAKTPLVETASTFSHATPLVLHSPLLCQDECTAQMRRPNSIWMQIKIITLQDGPQRLLEHLKHGCPHQMEHESWCEARQTEQGQKPTQNRTVCRQVFCDQCMRAASFQNSRTVSLWSSQLALFEVAGNFKAAAATMDSWVNNERKNRL